MSLLIIILFLLSGLIVGLIFAIRTYPKREVARLYKEFTEVESRIDGQFKHFSEKVDHSIRVIVKPNCETLYSTSFIKNPSGSYILKVPEIESYFSVAFLNESTDVLGYFTNKDLNDHSSTDLAINFESNWKNTMDSAIHLSAKMCWIIIRIGITDIVNIEKARQIQQSMKLIQGYED